ncbi:DUF5050 domain-containing protein [Clostridium chromiireducens]|nr:DUF5050 domain-containing protein [Clostridium chromiireducens]
MAKKIKFPLEMENGVMVRTLEQLKDDFSLEKVLNYYASGKLITWLNDRYYEDEAMQVEKLNSSSADFKQKLCEIFDVEYIADDEIDMEILEQRNIKISKLKQFTEDESIIKNVDSVAFNQEELADLLDEDITPIYLCSEEFTIPISKENVTYIGVNNPIININSQEDIDLRKKNITISNIKIKNKGKGKILGVSIKEEENNNNVVNDHNYLDSTLVRLNYGDNKNSDENSKDDEINEKIVRNNSFDNILIGLSGDNQLARDLIQSDVDGKNKKKIAESVSTFARYEGTVFYYTNYDRKIYKYDIETSKTQLLNIDIGNTTFHSPHLYATKSFIIWEIGGNIYRADYDGDFKEEISGDSSGKIRIKDHLLYSISQSRLETSIYKVDLNTKRRSTILCVRDDISAFDIYNNKIYFAEGGQCDIYCIYECDLDGGSIRTLKDHISIVKEIKCEFNNLTYFTNKEKWNFFAGYIENTISLDNV